MDAFGPPPFDALPRDREQAIAKFGQDMIQKNGQLPWRVEDMYGRLVRAFGDVKAQRPYGRDNVRFLSAVIAHYIGDAHVPFHAVVNYDGQLTNQHGLHSRFESALFERYRAKLQIRPAPTRLTTTPRDFVFDTLITSAGLVDPLLAADREAIGTGEVYDRAYFDRFFAKARPTVERRLSEAIAATAAVITHAWEAAGKPSMADLPATERRRRPAAAP
jgi:alkylated DNA nucleotide flippase Atl1